jgi:hypothetical protein
MPETPDGAAREAAARANRERYPEVAALIDRVRVHFPDARVKSIKPWSEDTLRIMQRARLDAEGAARHNIREGAEPSAKPKRKRK